MNSDTHPPGDKLMGPVPRPAVVLTGAAPVAARETPVLRPPIARPSAQAPSLTATGLLRALRRRSALALGLALLAAVFAGPAAWFLVPPAKFKAQALLQVAAQPPKVIFQTIETQNLGGEEYKRYQSTQQTLVKSTLVLNAALNLPASEPGAPNKRIGDYRMIREQVDAIVWLKENLGVDFVANSEVMEISMSGDDPIEVAGLVNAVKKAYIDEVVNRDVKKRGDRLARLEKIKKQYEDNLKERREMLRKLAETAGSNDRGTLALRQQYAVAHLEFLRNELLSVQSDQRKLEVRLKARPRPEETSSEPPAPRISEADIAQAIEQHPAVADLLDRLDERREQYDAARSNVGRITRGRTDPTLRPLREEITALARTLEGRRKEVRPVVIRQLQGQGRNDPVVRDNGIEEELAMLNDLEQRLTSEIGNISVDNQSLTKNTLDLQTKQDEVAQMEAAAEKVGAEVEALKVERDAPARVLQIEDASIPRTRDEKKRFLMIGMIVLGSFFGSLFGIAFLELQTRKVDSAEEVPIELGLQVVGGLPILPAKASRGRAIARRTGENEKDRYWRNLLLESIDATRTMLVHAARTGSYRVVMITSAVGGEGKTSLASYLATSLARSGLRTLLIDADLRSPAIHRLFDLPVTPGLSELLRGEVALDDVIGATAVTDLKVMAAGRCDRQALRVLAQGSLEPLFHQLKEQFNFVIVDSSPILPVADALLIAQNADAVLFSIFREVSRKTKVSAAAQRLGCLGVPVLGAVVTGAHGGLYDNDYYANTKYAALPESAAHS